MDPSDLKATTRILVELLNQPSTIEKPKVMDIDDPDWRTPIIEYLKSPSADTNSQSTKLRIRATRYTFIDEVIYKKSFTLPYLRCLGPDEVEYALREIHKGIRGQHMGSRSLAHKAFRQGYYWLAMKKDAVDFVKKCDRCQRFVKTAH